VTQGQFEAVIGWNPGLFGPNGSYGECGADCPVESVSWYDAVACANELSMDAALEPCYLLSNVSCEDAYVAVGTTWPA